ncbi:Copper amine oxidase [Cinnamomum micranthum f. kanehirae]|uniref:Copper amine oxidase n=1 Tax=Cinnamomum micranthum f. kanehirae TaxID=337451 RepID=A0A443PHG3_9MAGN|nr:Copper amine oxidase [Cinnamomum micranthum f. kanehirae]
MNFFGILEVTEEFYESRTSCTTHNQQALGCRRQNQKAKAYRNHLKAAVAATASSSSNSNSSQVNRSSYFARREAVKVLRSVLKGDATRLKKKTCMELLVSENIVVIHDHFVNFYLEMDINDSHNSFVKVHLTKVDASLRESPRKSYMSAKRQIVKTENDCLSFSEKGSHAPIILCNGWWAPSVPIYLESGSPWSLI